MTDVSAAVTGAGTLVNDSTSTGAEIRTLRFIDIFKVGGSVRIWLFVVATISAALCIMILFMPGLQNDDDLKKGDYI